MEQLEERIRERMDEARNETVYLETGANVEHEDRQALYHKMGYRPVRYFFDMERPLREGGAPLELPQAAYPEGITVQSMAQRPDLRGVWQACDEAFRDHWSATETTYEEWLHWTENNPNHQPELWLVAWDTGKDEPAGVCLNEVDPKQNERVGRQEGWVQVLAVRRPYRRQGLGRALLVAGLDALQREGMDWAMLGVDSENLTGALRLYEGVGFRTTKRYVDYRKRVRA
jgi:mycothiol synthase